MNSLQTTFLSMIRTALWGDSFVMDKNVKPIELLQEAYRYGIAGVLSTKLDLFCKDDEKTRGLWTKRALVDFRKSLQVLDAQEQLIKLLSKENIKPIFIKGTASSFYYPVPLLREIGDIDFLVLPNEFDRCVKLMEENGYGTSPDEERHLEYQKDGIEYEVHRYFTHKASDKELRLDELLFKGCESCITRTIEGKEFYTLPDIEYGIMLLEHIRHHLALGVGFRQVMDWVVYVDKVLDDQMWESQFQKVAENCGLEVLAKTLTKMTQVYLGLNSNRITWCNDIEESDCSLFIDILFSCNNFGFARDDFETRNLVKYTKKAGFLSSLNKSAIVHMPISQKIVILRPIAWLWALIRWVVKYLYSLVFKRDKNSNWSKSEWDRSQEFLKGLGVDCTISN